MLAKVVKFSTSQLLAGTRARCSHFTLLIQVYSIVQSPCMIFLLAIKVRYIAYGIAKWSTE